MLEALFDHLPRTHVLLGRRAVPVYLACGLAGALAGALVLAAMTSMTGRSLAAALGVAGVAVASFPVGGMIGKRLFGRERHSLLVDVYLALGGVAAVLVITGQPVLPYLDLFVVGLSVFLAFGRAGCAASGCCHGISASFGFLYPHDQRPGRPIVRRFPVQLVELAGWLALAAVAAIEVAVAPPGHATGITLLLYGLLRLALESLRGDERPRLLGLTEARWLSLLGVVVGLGLHWPEQGWPAGEIVLAAVGAASAALLYALRARWLTLPPPLYEDDPGARDPSKMFDRAVEIGHEIDAVALADPSASPGTWQMGDVTIAASVGGEGPARALAISVSRRGEPLTRAEAEWLLGAIACGVGLPPTRRPPPAIEPTSGLFLLEIPAGPELPPGVAGDGDAPVAVEVDRTPPMRPAPVASSPGYFEPRFAPMSRDVDPGEGG